MTWQCHPDVELPSFVTRDAHDVLYAPRGWEPVQIDLDKAAEQFYRPVTELGDLSTTEVKAYHQARAAEAAEAAEKDSAKKASRSSSKSEKADKAESPED